METLSLGEVLWDVLPDGQALGGAPANVARHLAQLGCEAHVVSAVGDDPLGREAVDRLVAKGLHVDMISVLPGKPTGTVEATLGPDGSAAYDFHADVAWDNIPALPPALALARRAKGMNFGSLSQRTSAAMATQHRFLEAASPGCVTIFDINLRAPFVFKDVLAGGFARTVVAKMNQDELKSVSDLFGLSADPEAAMAGLLDLYPNMRHMVVTRGAEGAWWHDRRRLIGKRARRNVRIADTIGAGDSITAVAMFGLIRGADPEAVLECAVEVAAYVCSQRGGMPDFPPEVIDRCRGL